MDIRKESGSAGACEAKSWYLVQCKPRQDERAEENLGRQGFACFRPQCRREKLRCGRRSIVAESLFPGYLFIRLASSDNWAPLRSTRGVSRLVGFGNHPLPVSDELIAQLRERVDSSPALMLRTGDRVRISSGGLMELDAIFLSMDGDERVTLLMTLLNREHRLSLPLTSVHKD